MTTLLLTIALYMWAKAPRCKMPGLGETCLWLAIAAFDVVSIVKLFL